MRIVLIALLLAGTAAFGEPIPYKQSLMKHGLEASAYGDVVVQKDSVLDRNLLSGRVQGGWLLTQNHYLAATVGATYAGLLSQPQGEHNGIVDFRYYGPVAELIAWPDSPLKPVLSYAYENGFFKHRTALSALDYDYSTVKMQELRFMLALSLGKYQQIILGLAEQDRHYLHFFKHDEDGDLYRRRGESKARELSYFAGLRLAAF